MKPRVFLFLLLSAALITPATAASSAVLKLDSAAALALKRVAERYALTKARIAELLEARTNPQPLPANLPNPFYQAPDLPAEPNPDAIPAFVEADASDASTLAKFVSTLKVSGLTVFNGVPHLTLNGTLCKEGDIIPVDVRGRTVYVSIQKITPDELTLVLNQDSQVVRLRR